MDGWELVLLNPAGAQARGIREGDIVERQNDGGRCLAGARFSDDISAGWVFMWTGAWWVPDYGEEDARDRHRNPTS